MPNTRYMLVGVSAVLSVLIAGGGIVSPAYGGFELRPSPVTAPPPAPDPGAVRGMASPPTVPPTSVSVTPVPVGAASGPVSLLPPGAGAVPGIVQGFGKDIPLRDAVLQIVPPDHMVTLGPGVDDQRPVSWKGKRPWRDVLADVADQAGLIVQDGPNGEALLKAGAAPADASPPPPPPPLPKWHADRGEMASDALRRWSGEEGVDLEWDANMDFPLKVPVDITGTYEQAVRELLRGIRHGRQRPYGQLHRNHDAGHPVLVVRTQNQDAGGE